MAKKKCPECPKGAPMWMTTFSDMTTLLLTFFVLLLSMANFDKVKMEQSFGILKGSSGIMTNPSVTPLSQMNIVAKRSLKDTVARTEEQVESQIKSMMQAQNMDNLVSVVKTDKGLSVRILDSALFRPGSAELLPEAGPILDKIINIVKDSSYYINIEGHTDDTGDSDFNWKLSTDRSLSVVRYFVNADFNPVRLSASGYGEYHPILPNYTEQNRSMNRRVEINMVTPEFSEAGKSTF